jgi:cellulose synthase/poly-beta-1,6-N-acetylglucosamine synthase-like glycosyltransferase
MRLKQKLPAANWFSIKDTEELLHLEEFQTIRMEKKILLPAYIPLLHSLFNRFLANLPAIIHLGLVSLHVSRPLWNEERPSSVSIVIPARNERGNIENAIKRTPVFGTHQKFIFIEGNSSDNTYEEILHVQVAYPDKNIRVMKQTGKEREMLYAKHLTPLQAMC